MRIQTRLKLIGLRWKQYRSTARFNLQLRRSGKTQAECSGEEWYADLCIEDVVLDDEERTAISDELIYQARRLYLPTPSLNDKGKWDERESENHFPRILTAEAMTELRAVIRKEHLERRANLEWWLKVVGGVVGILTGLVGALIGLVTVLKK